MMRIFYSFNNFLIISILLISCNQNNKINSNTESKTDNAILENPYLGQKPPGMTPELFAPGIVSTELNEDWGPIFSPDGNEILWRIGSAPTNSIFRMRRKNGIWQKPEMAPFSGFASDAGISMSPDGQKIILASKRPIQGDTSSTHFDLWKIEKENNDWGNPANIGAPINTDAYETSACIANDGSLILSLNRPEGKGDDDIYFSEFRNNRYTKPELLQGDINTEFREDNPYVSPDGDYLIFQSIDRPDSIGSLDLYVSFKSNTGQWSEGINLGNEVNSPYVDKFASITPDGKYIFFISDRPVIRTYSQYFNKRKSIEEMTAQYNFYHFSRSNLTYGDVYWVSTEIIEAIKLKNIPNEN
jgi:WD40-like Beta Propeller Repeat